MNFALRRLSIICWVGCPWSSSSQWRVEYAYGELRMGRSKNGLSVNVDFLCSSPLLMTQTTLAECRQQCTCGISHLQQHKLRREPHCHRFQERWQANMVSS